MITTTVNSMTQATLNGAPPSYLGTLGVSVLDAAENVVIERKTTSINEVPNGSGNYVYTFTAPATSGNYTVLWDADGVSTIEDLRVQAVAGLSYATLNDLKEYSLLEIDLSDGQEGFVGKVLKQAEKDIDRAVGLWPINTNGRKFTTQDMESFQKNALRDATCAQAEYRLQMGEEFFIQAQPDSVSGDDTNYNGRLPRLAPKAKEELLAGGLIRIGARATGHRGRRYPDFAERPVSQTQSNAYWGEND